MYISRKYLFALNCAQPTHPHLPTPPQIHMLKSYAQCDLYLGQDLLGANKG